MCAMELGSWLKLFIYKCNITDYKLYLQCNFNNILTMTITDNHLNIHTAVNFS